MAGNLEEKAEALRQAAPRVINALPLEQRAILERYYIWKADTWMQEAQEAYARGYAHGAKNGKE